MQTEIVITPSARGYRFELPEWCAPSPKLVKAFKAYPWLSYHAEHMGGPAYRLFPAEQLEFMTGLLNHWYAEQSASSLVGDNRNGGKIVAVRVAGTEQEDACGHDWRYTPFGHRRCFLCTAEEARKTENGDWLPSSAEARRAVSSRNARLIAEAQELLTGDDINTYATIAKAHGLYGYPPQLVTIGLAAAAKGENAAEAEQETEREFEDDGCEDWHPGHPSNYGDR